MINITWFDEQDIEQFPSPTRALSEPDGLLAAGGNLSEKTLFAAYRQGIFPWFEDGQPILWWSPSQRAVIATQQIHVGKNMKKLIKQNRYTLAVDTDFAAIVQSCSEITNNRQGTWITDTMRAAYQRLFEQGIAHSVAVYNHEQRLVGGLYGVFVRNCFCGESMFSREANTSKLALIALANFLQTHHCDWIDCQMPTPHLAAMGAKSIPRAEFLATLQSMQDNTRLLQRNWTTLWQP